MATIRKNEITYERDKNKVKIKGDPGDVKKAVWFDLITKELRWLVPVVLLLFIAPKASFIPVLLKWLKNQLSGWIFLLALVGTDILVLSG